MRSTIPAIVVQNLGKQYVSSAFHQSTLRENIYETLGLKNKSAYQDFWALRNVSFEIYEGEIAGIIGANGAGKSTLLKLLAGVTEPTEGNMQFCGKVVSILEIGTGFHPDLTGIENIYLSGSLLGMKQKEVDEKLSSIVEFSELGDFIHGQVKHFSSGMFLRLAFSVCTHLNSDILLLDEVISVGDAAFSAKCIKRIREIAAQGKTILIASHDLASVQHICTQCILLEKGTLLEVGQTSHLVERYIEEHVLKSLSAQQNKNAPALISERVFNNAKSESIQLHKVRVYPDQKLNSAITMKDSIKMECEFENFSSNPVAVTFVLTYNMQSVFLSADSFNSQSVSSARISGSGKFTATCIFPPVFFNHGIFSVSAYFTNSKGDVLFSFEDAVTIKIEQNSLSNGEIEYQGKFSGPLFPKLNWIIEKKGT